MPRTSVPEADALVDVRQGVLDHGFVRLVDYLGGDARIVQAARVSYGDGTKSVREDAGLIDYLLRHGHTSPFEQVVLTFHVKMPIFVARQWIRHRTARRQRALGPLQRPARRVLRAAPRRGALPVGDQQAGVGARGGPGRAPRPRRRCPHPRPARHLRRLRGADRGRRRARARAHQPPAGAVHRDGTGRSTCTTCSTSSGCAWIGTRSTRSVPTATRSPAARGRWRRWRTRPSRSTCSTGARLSGAELDVLRAAVDPERLRAALEASGLRPTRRRELLEKLGLEDAPATTAG